MHVKRLFVAIALPAAVRDALLEIGQNRNAPGWRWVAAENLHVTLLFIGPVTLSKLVETENTLADFAQNTPFELQLREITAIKRRGKWAMIWADFADSESFRELAQQMADRLHIPLSHPPVPHITLARAASDHRASSPPDTFPDVNHLQFTVREFGLWESVLQPSGALYTVRKTWALTEATSKPANYSE